MGQIINTKKDVILLKQQLEKMQLLIVSDEFSIYEQNDSQYEYWAIKSNQKDFVQEQQFAQILQNANDPAIVKIHYTEKAIIDDILSKEYIFAYIIDHPKYTLADYLKRNKWPTLEQIKNIFTHILGAFKILEKSNKLLGYQTIFTNNGEQWMMKPFQPYQSFLGCNTKTNKSTNSLILQGFNGPEEFSITTLNFLNQEKIAIFQIGMIVLSLLICKNYQELESNLISYYINNKFNERQLDEQLQIIKQQYQGKSQMLNFIKILSEMVDVELVRRPNYKSVLEALVSTDSGIKFPSISQNVEKQIQVLQSSKKNKIFDEIKKREIYLLQSRDILNQSFLKNTSKTEKQTSLSGEYYQGELQNGQKTGEGVIYYKNGTEKYRGTFKLDKYDGFGLLYYLNFKQQTGQLNYNDMNQLTQYIEKYEGNFQNSMKHGTGALYFSNGEYFIGDFENDNVHGVGQVKNGSEIVLTGKWNQGIYEKQNDFFLPNLSKAKEIICNGPMTFQEQEQEQEQEIKQQQQPTEFKFSKLSIYQSYIQQSIKKQEEQFNQIQQQNQQIIQLDKQKKYVGQIINNKMHGKGKIFFNEATLYEGTFIEGLYDGFGTLYNFEIPSSQINEINYKDLSKISESNIWSKYTGDFKKGKKHGTGRIYFSDESQYMGLFVDDNINGQGTYIFSNNYELAGIWNNGIFSEEIY